MVVEESIVKGYIALIVEPEYQKERKVMYVSTVVSEGSKPLCPSCGGANWEEYNPGSRVVVGNKLYATCLSCGQKFTIYIDRVESRWDFG
jgi:hypothetical protein